MKVRRHGLSVGIERADSHFFLSVRAYGRLTHQDYEKITPVIDSALRGVDDAKINVFFDASEMEGWELRAAWDDFKLVLKYGSEFSRVALFGQSYEHGQELLLKVGSWFISGEIRAFENAGEALGWLNADDPLKR